jgi:hypothetical protein
MPIRFSVPGELSPNQEDLAFAVSGLLALAGVTQERHSINVSAVAGVRRPAYHLLTLDNYTEPVSEILSAVLSRPFPRYHSGGLIDGREARALIEAARQALRATRE